jgi:hypothetical protein
MVELQTEPNVTFITAGGDFLCFCYEKSSYKHVSDLDGYGVITAFSFPYTLSCEPRLSSERPHLDT